MEIDINGIEFKLDIEKYEPGSPKNTDHWTQSRFEIRSGDWLHYSQSGELILSCEIDELADKISNLLNHRLAGVETLSFIEPDFEIVLHPGKNESSEPYMEWNVFLFCNGHYSDNYISLALNRKQIQTLQDYLETVVQKKYV